VIYTSDAAAFDGPLAGVYGGIEAINTPWLFLCGCDMPLLSPDAITWLIDRLATRCKATDPTPDALAVRHRDGGIDPLHALYRTQAIDQLRERISPTSGPRTVLESLPNDRTVPVDRAPAEVPLERSIVNVNTKDDLEDVVSRGPTEQ
jgi:molybdopterin-guanine dinucleotide biosynthesis protein A